MKKIKFFSIIISLLMILGTFTSCGKSDIAGNWSVLVNSSEYNVSVDNEGRIHKDNELIGIVLQDSKTIELSIQEDVDSNQDFKSESEEVSTQDFGLIIEKNYDGGQKHSSPAETTDKYTFKELAHYFGASSNIKNTESPTTEDEFKDSIIYNALLGNYIPYFKLDPNTEAYFFETDCGTEWLNEVALALPELVGSYSNASLANCFSGSNPCTFYVCPQIEALTQQQIYNRQIEALNKALEIDNSLRSSGKITDNMSDMQKAKAFADYLKALEMDPSRGGDCPAEENMYYDTAFSGLVQNVAACGGRAASYNLLLRTEGIACTAIGCTVNEDGGGHYVNRMILDGKEYFYDWYNESWFPNIMTKSEAEKIVTFYDGQYEYTGKLLEQWE